ncbi:hypothetical protein BDQ12DRAFT_686489 [Crucibulum laeve]|uniref:Uncharacterized protein n=1 Tax=Crucibulum laeve TaxID=68775 RepID=A0A5C3LVU9_9AGAR|nr:hypothetical protein BDQ12DRAFT_686489 [Crucibulum laeve]
MAPIPVDLESGFTLPLPVAFLMIFHAISSLVRAGGLISLRKYNNTESLTEIGTLAVNDANHPLFVSIQRRIFAIKIAGYLSLALALKIVTACLLFFPGLPTSIVVLYSVDSIVALSLWALNAYSAGKYKNHCALTELIDSYRRFESAYKTLALNAEHASDTFCDSESTVLIDEKDRLLLENLRAMGIA